MRAGPGTVVTSFDRGFIQEQILPLGVGHTEHQPFLPAESPPPQNLVVSLPRRCWGVQDPQECLWGREGPADPEMVFSGANTEQGKGRLSLAQ